MKKRILLLLTVVALLMVTLAMSVVPAFGHDVPCTGKNPGVVIEGQDADYDPTIDRDDDGIICRYNRFDKNGGLIDTRYRDDHDHAA